MISEPDRARLLAFARAALVARVTGAPPPVLPDDIDVDASGVFVTIHVRGDLRGCLGTLDAREPITIAVSRLAADVSHRDYRFPPVSLAEIDHLTLEMSVLTPPQRVSDPSDPSEIVVGRDGLIVEHGSRTGLLLPQVAPEHGWGREELLAHTCVKAGLPADAWQHGASVYRFEAEVFREQ